jgi:hypothetical protein
MKEHLGDAVFVDHDGYHVVLTTEDGVQTTNRIYLDPGVFTALYNWHRHLQERFARAAVGGSASPLASTEAE